MNANRFFMCAPFVIALLSGNAPCQPDDILFEDNFSNLPTGHLFSGDGAHLEYQYLPEAGPKGNWFVSTFTSKSPHISRRNFDTIRCLGRCGSSSLHKRPEGGFSPPCHPSDPVSKKKRRAVNSA